MRLTSFTDYGLRMLMRIASAPGQAFSSAELADEFGLSRHHLAKIMQRLAGAGLVTTRRGGGGGAVLARPAAEIRLGALVRLLEDGQPLVECLGDDGGACVLDGRCRLKARLRSAEATFLADLDRSTLADIALPPGRAPGVARRIPQARLNRTAHLGRAARAGPQAPVRIPSIPARRSCRVAKP